MAQKLALNLFHTGVYNITLFTYIIQVTCTLHVQSDLTIHTLIPVGMIVHYCIDWQLLKLFFSWLIILGDVCPEKSHKISVSLVHLSYLTSTLRRTRSEYYIDSGGSLHEESRRLIAGDGSTMHNIMGTCSSEKPGIFKSTRPVCVLNTMLFALWI